MKSSLLALTIITFFQCNTLRVTIVLASNTSPGETTSRVEFEVGGNENITCTMNLTRFPGKNSSSLYFIEYDTEKQVPSTDIAIVDEKTIVYMMRNASIQSRQYMCKSSKYAIGLTYVGVGTAPGNVTDFKCIGYDYQYMVCNFTVPKNTIHVKYELKYIAKFSNYVQNCEVEMQANNRAICNLTNGNYRKEYEFFNFTLTGTNKIGINTQYFCVNHYESVVPPRPEFKIEHISVNTVVLAWELKTYSYYNSKGLQYEVRAQPQNFDWIYLNYEPRNNKKEFKLILLNLPYANYWYNVSLRIKVKKASNDGTMWSESHVESFRSKECEPYYPPNIDVGSFYIGPTEKYLRLFWQKIPIQYQNGPNFTYVVTQFERNSANVVMNKTIFRTNHTSMDFPWDKSKNYEYTIRSHNIVGYSVNESRILVPYMVEDHKRKSMIPLWILSVYDPSNKTYTLSWNKPKTSENLIDFTVFWCPSKHNECKDSINFQHINVSTTKYSKEVKESEDSLNFAVSANYDGFNTGLHWVNCTAYISSELAKLELEMIDKTANSFQLQWSLERVCTSLLEGYNLTYCLVENSNNTQCLSNKTTIPIAKTEKKFVLTNLKPFTTYKVEILMFSKLKVSKPSNTCYITTKEDAPTPPRSLVYNNVTSNLASISWMPPILFNGILQYYTVVYNNHKIVVNCSKNNELKHCDTKIDYQLKNLDSFTTYKVYITAHTVESSAHSNYIEFTTLIGVPSPPQHMMPNESFQHLMQWSRPAMSAGNLDFYEVIVTVFHKDQMRRQRISGIIGSTQCNIQIPECNGANSMIKLKVRAVNIVDRKYKFDEQLLLAANNTVYKIDVDAQYYEGNEDLQCLGTAMSELEQNILLKRYRDTKNYVQYKSEWESGPYYGCIDQALFIGLRFLGIFLIAVGLIIFSYFARIKYKKMSDISCVLPSTLTAYNGNGINGCGLDNGNVEKDEDFRRSKESLYNNEHRHLLSSFCNDSGYIGRGSTDSSGDITINNVAKNNGYISSDNSMNYTQSDQIIDKNGTAINNDAYMVMEKIKPKESNLNHNLNIQNKKLPLVENGYINPNAVISLNPTLKCNFPLVSANSYLKPNKINWQQSQQQQQQQQQQSEVELSNLPNINKKCEQTNILTFGKNGYIEQSQILQIANQPTSSDGGYTTLEALGKSKLASHSQSPTTPLQTTVHGGLPQISGYVTQEELSAFGNQRIS